MKNSRRRRWHLPHLRNPILWMGLIPACFFVFLLCKEVDHRVENFRSQEESAAPAIDFPAMLELWSPGKANGPADDRHHGKKDGEGLRRVYPYSVVQGGVHSVQELRSAMFRDSVVAKHYSNFKLERARVIEARADGNFHVSYRLGEEIFWTKKKLKVAKSEKLITDGTTFTRTRCANVLSDVLPGKTSPDEPAPEAFDRPALPPSHARPFPPTFAAGGDPPTTPLPPDPAPSTSPGVVGGDPPADFAPPVFIAGGSPGSGGGSALDLLPVSGPVSDSGLNPAPVPEPATLLLLVSGLLGLAGYGRRKFLKK